MIDLILCFPIKSIESLNGKKASEARTAPGGIFVLVSAYLTASTRLVCPPEILTIFLLCATTIALDFACLTAFQASLRVKSSVLVGAFLVTVLSFEKFIFERSVS